MKVTLKIALKFRKKAFASLLEPGQKAELRMNYYLTEKMVPHPKSETQKSS